MEEKRRRIKELVGILNNAARAYEQEDREFMSNYEYDGLYDELCELEGQTGIVLSNSPTMRAGYEIVGALPKERHDAPMLSLNKTKDVSGLVEFLGDKDGVMSWKMDGVTIVLTYLGGVLAKAVTRGNGEEGEVVTSNAKTFMNLPLSIPYKGELVLRGEAVISYADFERINAEIGDADARYKNPRNLCSGAVRQLNSEITAKRRVGFYAFALIGAADIEADVRTDIGADAFASHVSRLAWLASQGFDVVEYRLVNRDTVVDAVSHFKGCVETYGFPTDGLVLTYDDVAYGTSLGRTSKFPRDSIAFKWKDEVRETRLIEIEWSASRTGLVNPIAIFEPVELEGTTVGRASLHNVSIMEGLELAVGDTILVYKANMIIPQVADNLTRGGVTGIPTTCPVCGMETEVRDDNGIKALFCNNPNCAAKKVKAFTHFASRDAMNIEGFSEATIEKFIGAGIIHELVDIFHLEGHQDVIENMEGFGKKSYGNLLESVNKARRTTLARFIFSLGIANVGLSTAKLICKECHDSLDEVMGMSREALTDITGIGGVIADAFTAFFKNEDNRRLVNALREELEFEAVAEAKGGLDGLTFVITGEVEHFANRNELKAFIEANGGKVAGSVSGRTDYLINNDALSGSAKNKKARELGVKVVTEEELMSLFTRSCE